MKTSKATQATPTGTEKSATRLFSIGMLMEQLSISRPTANRLVYGGFVKTVRLGRAVRIPESSVMEFIANGGERNIVPPAAAEKSATI